MAYYIDATDEKILNDTIRRKEFVRLANPTKDNTSIVPYFSNQSSEIILRLRSYQQFVRNWMNPNTPYTRLAVIHDMGTGKTISTLSIAMSYINFYKRLRDEMFFVYIIGFTRPQYERDLLRFVEFGFVSENERKFLTKLKKQANSKNSTPADVEKYATFLTNIRRRFSNRKGNGYFKFLGYGELVNNTFYNPEQIMTMNEHNILAGVKDGTVKINVQFVEMFKNCLIICDEIHNTYNSQEKNNYGIALQVLLNYHGANIRGVFASGTILTNSPKEVVDVANLLSGTSDMMYTRNDFFDEHGNLLSSADKTIEKAFRGKVSFLVDTNPALYPSSSYAGESLPNSKYLKFHRCLMTPIQEQLYLKINSPDQFHENPYIFDIVLPGDVYKSSQMNDIYGSTKEWKDKYGFVYENGVLSGPFFAYENIKNYSSKYAKMLELLSKTHGEKVFIFHKFVKMSGAHMITTILLENGYIEHGMTSNQSTRCALCNKRKGEHPADTTTNESNNPIIVKKQTDSHAFAPASFILVFGEMKRNDIVSAIDRYNDPLNHNGSIIQIIIGTLVMRESYDLKACRHVYVISRPDNIPSLLQITARAVRGDSHTLLDPDKRNVLIHIFTSMLSNKNALSYEEEQWMKKIDSYITIQKIERIIHQTAIDSIINLNIINRSLVDDAIGHLRYDVAKIDVQKVNSTTFDAYFGNTEINEITYVIKRLFMEYSQVWKFDDLVANIKRTPFSMDVDTSLFDDDNIAIAIDQIVYDDKEILPESNTTIELLHNSIDKRIMLYGRVVAIIKMVGEYLIAFPLNNGVVRYDVDEPYRNVNIGNSMLLNVDNFVENIMTAKLYEKFKIDFKTKYEDVNLSMMGETLSDFGVKFHTKFIEEIIENIYGFWTNPQQSLSKVYGNFYFKMLYYYDMLGIVAWLDAVPKQVRNMYEREPIETKNTLLPDNVDDEMRGRLIQLTRKIEAAGCAWCPSTTEKRFHGAVEKSKLMSGSARGRTMITDDMIPIGHYLESQPKYYHPDRGWVVIANAYQAVKWKENDIIIGFDVRTESGLQTKFHLRNPKHKMKSQHDARMVERGMLCLSKSKDYLKQLYKKLDAKKIEGRENTVNLCIELRARLLYLELMERAKGSNIKYYYNQYERM